MQIHISTDKNVHGSDALMRRVEQEFESAFSRSSDRITRLEVHLGDEIAARAAGLDRRCVLEARLAGHGAVSVTHHAGSVTDACHGAIRKLESVLESKFGRLYQHKGGESIRHLDVSADPVQTFTPTAGAH
ncbi:HPF/RaiA family ribosome-associated protein [Amycolatopsis sp. NPDC051128]|uniref:HPF/RaiA family ribosome-associated protein n=1 Tax=Amycolatopsis sp. NPDC051128 TaxID=3155412 RepID=UPI00342EEEA7